MLEGPWVGQPKKLSLFSAFRKTIRVWIAISHPQCGVQAGSIPIFFLKVKIFFTCLAHEEKVPDIA